MTGISYPFVPHAPSGDWVVTLPGDASIGEVIVYATNAPPPDPWNDAPLAPTGTTISVASTFIVPASYIDAGGDSAVVAIAGHFVEKMLFRCTGTPPPASISTWQFFDWYYDPSADGTYASAGYTPALVASWTWYGPGDTTPDGLVLPADTGALYFVDAGLVSASDVYRLGTPLVNRQFEVDMALGTHRVFWSSSTTTLDNKQRFDDAATHTTPLIPDRLS